MTVLISHNCDDSLTPAISVTVLQICDNHCDFNDIVVTPKFVRTVKSYTNFSNAARF